MELRHLRYFIAAAQEENVSRAALKLHVSQPGISRQIRDLEEEIGFKLFERTAKSIKLTPAGELFLKEARAILQHVEEAVQKARALAGGTRELHVGYAPSLTARFLPQSLRLFQAEAPNIRVKLHDCSTEEMAEGLRSGKLHLALTLRASRGPLRNFQFMELTRETLCVALALKHPLARRQTVSLEEIAREPFVSYSRSEYPEAYDLILGLFAKLKLKPRIVEEHDSVSSLIAAVEAGTGAAIVPRSLECTSGPRLTLLSLSPAPEPIVIGAAWLKPLTQPAAEQFLNSLKQVTAQK